MDVANVAFFGVAGFVCAEREHMLFGDIGVTHRDGHAAHPGDGLADGERCGQRGCLSVRVCRCVFPRDVEVDDQVLDVGQARRRFLDRVEQGLEIGVGRLCRDQVEARTAQIEVAGDDLPAVDDTRTHVLEGPDLVRTTGDDLEQRAGHRARSRNLLGEKVDERFRSRHERVDTLRVVRGLRMFGEIGERSAHPVVDLLARFADDRLFEVAVAQVAGDVADHWEADLCRDDHPVEILVELARDSGFHVVAFDPAVEQRGNHRYVRLDSLEREEQTVHRLLEIVIAFEFGDVVVVECARETSTEAVGQTTDLDVERLQVSVEELTRTVYAVFGVAFLVRRTVAREFAHVGERGQQRQFGANEIARLHAAGESLVLREQRRGALGRHVVSGDQGTERVESCEGIGGEVVAESRSRRGELDALDGLGDDLFDDLVDAQQRCACVHLRVHDAEDLPDPAGERRTDSGLHLHRFENDQGLACFYLVAHGDGDRDDDGGRRGADDTGLVLADLVADPVDLDEEMRRSRDRDDVVAAAVERESRLVVAQTLYLDVELGDSGVEAIAVRTDLSDDEFVGLSLITQFDLAADGVPGARPAAPCRREERGAFAGLVRVVHVDGGGDQRDVGDLRRSGFAAGTGPVEPAGIGGRVDDLRTIEQVEQERLGGGASVEDDRGFTERGAQPGERFGAVPSPRDDLRDHRVVVGGNHVPLSDAGIHPQPRTERELQQLHGARRGCETVGGVLGVEPGLDGVAEFRRALPGQSFTRSHHDLQLDEVDTGGDLGDRVLDLQAGVDLEEGEGLQIGLVEVLDGAGTAVPGSPHEVGGDLAEVIGLLRGEQRGCRFLDDLLVLTLDGAVAHTRSPHVAVGVRDDLHLDVARVGDEAFDEHDRVAEGPLGFPLGALECQFEFVFGVDLADTAAAAAGPRLDDERVADGLRVTSGVGAGVDGPTGPRCDRHADLFGEKLGLDLVAEQAHRVPGRSDEGDVQPGAQVRECGVLCYESPADPDCVGFRLEECALEFGVIEIGGRGRGRRVERDPLVGLTDEHCTAFGVGMESDRPDAVVVFGVELPDCPDETDSRLTPVDHCDPLEHTRCHRSPLLCAQVTRASEAPPRRRGQIYPVCGPHVTNR